MRRYWKYLLASGLYLSLNACTPSSSAVEVKNPAVDWSLVFASWQEGCRDSEIFSQLSEHLYNYPEDAVAPQKGFIQLPDYLKASVDPEIEIEDHEESRSFIVNVKNGQYYGMKLNKIVVYAGKGNGINGRYIEVEQSDAQLRDFLKKVKFERDWSNPSEYGHDQAILEVQDQHIKIACDNSM